MFHQATSPVPSKIHTLTCLETVAQAKWFVANNSSHFAGDVALAVTPDAAYACQELNQPYLKLEDYSQVLNRLAEYTPVVEEYLAWESWLDDWAQQEIREFKDADFKPACATSFLLQMFFSEIWATTITLREFFETVNPERVALWPAKIVSLPWYLLPVGSPLPLVMLAVAHTCGVEVVDMSLQSPDFTPTWQVKPSDLNLKQLIDWAKPRLRQHPLAVAWVKEGIAGLLPMLSPTSPTAPHFLFSGYAYDLEPLARELRQRGARVTVLPDVLPPFRLMTQTPPLPPAFKQRFIAVGESLLQQPNLWAPVEKWGLERTDIWSKTFQSWWSQIVPELWWHYQTILPRLKQGEFAAVITWDTGGNSLSSAVVQAANRAKVPCYIYQHGSSSNHDARLWQAYLRHSDTFLVYGAGTVDELEQSYPAYLSPQAKIKSVGSTRLDELRRLHRPEKAQILRQQLQAGDNRPLILYVPTCFGVHGRAISELAAYPDVSYMELQQTILKLWQESPGVRLLYKELAVGNIPSRVISNFVQAHIPGAIVTTHRLTDLMWAVDAIVVDHMVTAIGEILLTNKPLVVYMPRSAVSTAQSERLLRKRATVAENPAEFVAHVRTLLKTEVYHDLATPNCQYRQIYCTHLDDGRSAERAAALILQGLKTS